MAFPQVTSDIKTGAETTNVTVHSVTLPSDVSAGNLILVMFAVDASETLTVDTVESGENWVIEVQQAITAVTSGVIWKISEGAGNDTLVINTTTEMASYIAYGITGIRSSDPITVSTYATGTGANMNPSAVTPLYGAQDYLWFVFGALDATVAATGAPTDFSNLLVANGSATQGCTCSVARRQYNTASSYDPGAFTSSAEDWIAFTIVVNPTPPLGIGISGLFVKN